MDANQSSILVWPWHIYSASLKNKSTANTCADQDYGGPNDSNTVGCYQNYILVCICQIQQFTRSTNRVSRKQLIVQKLVHNRNHRCHCGHIGPQYGLCGRSGEFYYCTNGCLFLCYKIPTGSILIDKHKVIN